MRTTLIINPKDNNIFRNVCFFEEMKAKGIYTAEQLQELYDEKVRKDNERYERPNQPGGTV